VKGKDNKGEISKMVTDTLFNLRRILIEKKINSLRMNEMSNENERVENMGAIIDYTNLKMRLAERLERVV
jgi:DNA primase